MLGRKADFPTKITINLDKQSTPLDLHFYKFAFKRTSCISLSFLILFSVSF